MIYDDIIVRPNSPEHRLALEERQMREGNHVIVK